MSCLERGVDSDSFNIMIFWAGPVIRSKVPGLALVFNMMYGAVSHEAIFRGMKRKRKPLGLRAMAPCVTSPHPKTDLPEVKQLRMCLLSERGLGY